jgi:hypothetical protein
VTSSRKSVAPGERPRLLVVAGPNGSGKSSVTGHGLSHEWFRDCLNINPDDPPVRLIFRCNNGKAEKTYGIFPVWAEPIWRTLGAPGSSSPAAISKS